MVVGSGVSLGGLVALELAQMLWQQGQEVRLLALINPPRPGRWVHEVAYRRYLKHIWRMTCLTGCEWYLHMGYRMPPFLRRPYFHAVNYHAVSQYVPPVYPGRGVLFHAMQNSHDPYAYWPDVLAGGLEVYNIPGSHLDLIFSEASVQILGESLTTALESV